MEKKTIILMIVTIVAFIILIAGMCYGFFFSANKEQEENKITQEVNAEDVQEESNVVEEEKQENIIETPNNVSENVTVEEPVVQNVPDTSSQIIGKEEAETANENVGLTEEEKAIELVKEKWGAQDTSVVYAVANREGNIYMISVTNKETTAVLAWYQVNMQTEEVVQQ